MSRMSARFALLAALALLGFGSAGFARASVVALNDIAKEGLAPSSAPALLGPINELGRNGWNCLPEQAVRAKRATTAQLPAPDDP